MRFRLLRFCLLSCCLLAPILLYSITSIGVELDTSDTVTPDHEQAKTGIERKYQLDKARCTSLAAHQQPLCEQQAETTARLNEQSLDARRNDSIKDHINAGEARTEAQYDLDKVRCADMVGDSKALCLQRAKAEFDKSKSSVDHSKDTLEQSRNAAENRTEQAYANALKKCDRLPGLKKEQCQDLAKEKYRN